nr:histidine kinase dimerization/phosphoacceptor domain -containing protein [Faunimonas pinastri]
MAIEEKRVHAKLAENERQFRLLAGSIPQLVWMADAAGSLFWFNQRWYDFTGSDSDAMKEGGWMELLHPEHRDRVTARLQKSWDTGEPWEDTFPLRGANGVYRWFLSRAMPFKDGDGRVVRWFGTNTDITEQREAEERQKMLSQEVSHRVKNSLAMVASLLGLQSRVVANEEVRRAIADAQTRVQTIAQVHDQLWRRYDANNIDLAGFLQGLCVKLQETSLEHRIQFEGEPVSIRTDRVIPIGILVNELVTNAFKYAYPEGGGGQVRVSLATEEDGSIVMSVSDRGVGLPHGFDLSRSTSSLGTRLISAMVRQLSGTIQTSRLQPGACFEVRIPSDEAVEGGWHPAA